LDCSVSDACTTAEAASKLSILTLLPRFAEKL
jgi:hypothetical protein